MAGSSGSWPRLGYLEFPKYLLIGKNSGMGETGLLGIPKDAPLTPITQKIRKDFGAVSQGLERKTKHVFLIISQCQ